jgi:hypothetical protein
MYCRQTRDDGSFARIGDVGQRQRSAITFSVFSHKMFTNLPSRSRSGVEDRRGFWRSGPDSRKRVKFRQAGEARHITLSASGAVFVGTGSVQLSERKEVRRSPIVSSVQVLFRKPHFVPMPEEFRQRPMGKPARSCLVVFT